MEYKKGAAMSNSMVLGGLVLFAGVILLSAYMISSSFTMAIGQPVTPTPQGTTGSGVCDYGNNQPTLTFGGYYLDPTNNNQQTPLTSWYGVYVPNTIVPVSSGTFSVNGNTTTAGQIACHGVYNLVMGDGGNGTYSGYYYKIVQVSPDKTVNKVADQLMLRAGAPTISVGNSSTFEAAAVTISNASYTTNSVIGTETMKVYIKKSNDGTCFGDSGVALCLRYNGTAFSWVLPQISYVKEFSQNNIQGTATTGKNKVQCFQMTSTPFCGGTLEIPIQAKRSSTELFARGDAIDAYALDVAGILFNGGIVVGTDTSVTTGGNTDAGRSNPNLQAGFTFEDG